MPAARRAIQTRGICFSGICTMTHATPKTVGDSILAELTLGGGQSGPPALSYWTGAEPNTSSGLRWGLMDRTSHRRKRVIGIRPNEPNGANHKDQDHS